MLFSEFRLRLIIQFSIIKDIDSIIDHLYEDLGANAPRVGQEV